MTLWFHPNTKKPTMLTACLAQHGRSEAKQLHPALWHLWFWSEPALQQSEDSFCCTSLSHEGAGRERSKKRRKGWVSKIQNRKSEGSPSAGCKKQACKILTLILKKTQLLNLNLADREEPGCKGVSVTPALLNSSVVSYLILRTMDFFMISRRWWAFSKGWVGVCLLWTGWSMTEGVKILVS